MVNNLKTLHMAIIAVFCLIFLAGCGYKVDPFYTDFKQEIKAN